MIAVRDTLTRSARVQEISSLLVANGYVSKNEFPELLYDEELREQVADSLDMVGLKFLINSKSEYWGVGLNSATAADDRLEWSNNFGLDRGSMALLLILWCKLILPKRLDQSEASTTDDPVTSLFPELEIKPDPATKISREQIIAEFSDVLGGAIVTAKYIAQLTRAKLIRSYGGFIEEGPLLALVVDENKLTDELHREVLISVLNREKNTKNKQPMV